MSKRLVLATLLAAAALQPALAADVGVSVSIGQPGFYGRIDIGNFPQPQIIYPQAVIIAPGPVAIVQQPIYLRVPPGHYNNWGKHCSRYNACGQRVYFVQDGWYNNVYAPAYRRGGRGDDRGDRGGYDRSGHGGHDHDRGPGQGKGPGKGQGHGKGPKHDR
jgi:hypothetical protein